MGDLRIGVVGLGWVAGAHIETFKHVTGARITAVCSSRKQDPAELEKKYGVKLKVYNDFAAMLKDKDIDAIDICTPHHLHAEQAIAAAKAGKHLIIEKPICLNFEQAKAIRDAVKKAGVQACVCFECRYSAHFTMVRSILQQGLLGELHYGEVDYYHGIGPWYGQFNWNIKKEFGGSSLLTAGCHALDSLLMFMNEPVEEVTSYATASKNEIFKPYEYKTTSTTILKFKNGKAGKVASCIDCLQPYYFHVHLVGSHGSLLDNKFYSSELPGMTKARWSTLETALIDSGDVSDHPYQPQFQAFVDSLAKGREMPLTGFDVAFESHRVTFAADLSAQRGTPVKLSEIV
ncbi:MAG TPA: Gfo/Idh/MocA family oxidoreductase [Planctomycetota bacterium]|nr:Gfo/Idh/MocA family oxidoreductase [Planctomycetota bacterium]